MEAFTDEAIGILEASDHRRNADKGININKRHPSVLQKCDKVHYETDY